jgi:hypothetical protein
MRTIESQRKDIRNLEDDMESGMILDAKDVRKEVFCEYLSSLMCSIVGFARGGNFAEQPSEMDKRVDDLRTWDRVVQGEQPPRKVSARESQNKQNG